MLLSSQFQTRISGAGNGLMMNSMDTGMFNSKMSQGGMPEELMGHKRLRAHRRDQVI